jgi:pSer/pThr/pTyr-binding forkhead associated (FHA) protein
LKPACLIVHYELLPPDRYVLQAEETLIGRGLSCDLQVLDPAMSREHATISWDGDQYLLEDLGTTNGTKLNGRRIRSGALDHGDEISIANTHFVFRLEG